MTDRKYEGFNFHLIPLIVLHLGHT